MKELEIYLLVASAIAIGAYIYDLLNEVDCRVCVNGLPVLHNYEKTSDLTIARLPPYEPTVIVDLSVIPNMTNESITNITVRIGENQLQNVTIWKGDEIVAYIPRTS